MFHRNIEPGAPDVATPLHDQLEYLDKLVEPHLTPGQYGYWRYVWGAAVRAAAAKNTSNRSWFYRFQAVSSASAVIIPALVGLNLSGEGGVVVRWLTFAVGLLGALATAALQLFRSGSRWRLNRDYYSDLIRKGRDFGLNIEAAGKRDDKIWQTFQSEVSDIIERYNSTYDSAVISPTQPGVISGPGNADRGTSDHH